MTRRALREQLARALAELWEDRKRKGGGKVINTEQVFRVFRRFQQDFPTRPAHEQREILRSVVSKVVVQGNGLRVFYYGSPRDDKPLDASPAAIEAKLLGKLSAVPASKAAKKAANVTNSGPSFDGTGVRAVSGLVDQAGHWTNSKEIVDFIGLFAIPKNAGTTEIADLYLKERLTAAQVAVRIGFSKASVLRRLHSLGIRKETLSEVAKDHPRPAVRAPYGHRIIAGKLVSHRQEQKVARLIVELRARQELSWKDVVQRLHADGLRTRNGIPWKVGRVRMVFAQWESRL